MKIIYCEDRVRLINYSKEGFEEDSKGLNPQGLSMLEIVEEIRKLNEGLNIIHYSCLPHNVDEATV